MAKVSTTEAARLAGVDRSTLWRKCQAGTVSYETDADGRRVFDVAELERAFGPLQRLQPSAQRVPHPAVQPPATDAPPGLLQRLEADLDRVRAELERERAERLAWQQRYVEQTDRLTRLLTGPATVAPTQPGPMTRRIAGAAVVAAAWIRARWLDQLRNA